MKRPNPRERRGSFLTSATPVAMPLVLLSTAALLRNAVDLHATPSGRACDGMAPPPGPGWGVPAGFPPPPAATGWLDDVQGPALACGNVKCLFGSRASRRVPGERNRDRHGYLVSQQNRPQERINEGWDLARELAARHCMRHLLLAAPVRRNCTEDLAARLSRYAKLEFSATKHTGDPTEWRKTQLVVQPVRLAPKDSVLFGCYRAKRDAAYAALEDFFAGNKHGGLELDAGRRDFEKRVWFDYDATLRMLASPAGVCLANDFQVLVDPVAGSIYHLDFDRCNNDRQYAHLGLPKTCADDLKLFLLNVIAKRTG